MQQTLELWNPRHTQRNKILTLLKSKNFVSTSVLRMVAYQYNARIKELRSMGYVIESCRNMGRSGFKLLGWRT